MYAVAANLLLDRVEARSTVDGRSIRVLFNVPVAYVSHAPVDRGQVLRIEIRQLGSIEGTAAGDPIEQESISAIPSGADPLREVVFEPTIQKSGTLTLTFHETVTYSVAAGRDGRSIEVVLIGPAESTGVAAATPLEAPAEPSVSEEAEATTTGMTTTAASEISEVVDSAAPTAGQEEVAQSSAPSELATGQPPAGAYVVTLFSRLEPVDPQDIPQLDDFAQYRLYTAPYEAEGRVWTRYRLGFFASKNEAQQAQVALLERFPGCWVAKVSKDEQRRSVRTALRTGAAVADVAAADEPVPAPTEEEKVTTGTDKALPTAPEPEQSAQEAQAAESQADLPEEAPAGSALELAMAMDEAKTATTSGDNRRAVQLYTKILTSPGNEDYKQEAKELLGLAREREGQLAHAKAEYEEYLELYPEGEASDRVRQRLAALVTADLSPPADVAMAEDAGAAEEIEEDSNWELSGSFSQTYTRDQLATNDTGTTVNQHSVDSNLDVVGGYHDDRFDITVRGNGGYVRDFLQNDESEGRLSALYFEFVDNQTEFLTRLGRQSRSSGGVLGRFDGGYFRYQATPEIRVNLAGGFLVESSTDLYVNNERHFSGVSLEFGPFFENWNSNIFFIDQRGAEFIVDRQAVGGELRYVGEAFSAFGLVDFDVSYTELNIALLNGTYTFPDHSTVGLALDYRTSPILTTNNALIGQPQDSLEDLLDILTEGQVRALAEARTAVTKTATLNATHPITEEFQIGGDITITGTTATDATTLGTPVAATPATGPDFFYGLQFTKSNVVTDGDIAVLGLRYGDTDASDRYSLDINTRFPIEEFLRVNPRFRAEYRTNKDNDGTLLSLKPSLRLSYFLEPGMQFDVEGGADFRDEEGANAAESSVEYFVIGGFRIDF